jgi:superfamily II DNA or RNA helicase
MTITELKGHYRTGKDDLRHDFFAPCLAACTRYRRAAGYFSSSALLSWADALTLPNRIADLHIDLLISPILRAADLDAIGLATNPEERKTLLQRAADQIVIDILQLLGTKDTEQAIRLQAQVIAWLVATEHLTIRFAIPEHLDDAGIFHEKIGIFDFPNAATVAFSGSANETIHGHVKNYESIDVYRSWVPSDAERVTVKIEQFVEAWEGNATGLLVLHVSPDVLERVRQYSVTNQETLRPTTSHPPAPVPEKWVHQDLAVAEFLRQRRGVLEMATGTGKTRTAIKVLDRLTNQNAITGVILTTDGIDLLDQWVKELDSWSLTSKTPFRVFRHYGEHHELASFANNPHNAIICISRSQLAHLFAQLTTGERQALIIIHDEVHGLGSPANQRDLRGEHEGFAYCLGLSATPEREYDQDGTAFITEEIGPVIFRFDIKDAIQKGILCEFDYVPLPYQLTENDKQRLKQVYAREAARKAAGNPMSPEEVWIELARVYKTAEMKPSVFAGYLQQRDALLKCCIIFVEDRAFGQQIVDIIAKHTYRYRTYYADDDRENLLRFAKNEIDCLLTCHRISQGIDIRGLRTVVLFSSSRSRLETIQRIGRCLRTDPSAPYKRSLVIDFVLSGTDNDNDTPDAERKEWLEELSRIRATV